MHFWWCFYHDLDMLEIKKWQLRDTRLKVHLLFRVFQHQILVFVKAEIIIFMIVLSNDNQWTVEWHTWLPYKTNQFHVQHDFLISSKRPVLVRAWQKVYAEIRVALKVCFNIDPRIFRNTFYISFILAEWISRRSKPVQGKLCTIHNMLIYWCPYLHDSNLYALMPFSQRIKGNTLTVLKTYMKEQQFPYAFRCGYCHDGTTHIADHTER